MKAEDLEPEQEFKLQGKWYKLSDPPAVFEDTVFLAARPFTNRKYVERGSGQEHALVVPFGIELEIK